MKRQDERLRIRLSAGNYSIIKDEMIPHAVCISKGYSVERKFCRLTGREVNANPIAPKSCGTDKIHSKARNIERVVEK